MLMLFMDCRQAFHRLQAFEGPLWFQIDTAYGRRPRAWVARAAKKPRQAWQSSGEKARQLQETCFCFFSIFSGVVE